MREMKGGKEEREGVKTEKKHSVLVMVWLQLSLIVTFICS